MTDDDTAKQSNQPDSPPAPAAVEATAESAAQPAAQAARQPEKVAATGPKRHLGTPLWLTIVLIVVVAAEPFALRRFLPETAAAPPSGDPAQLASLQSRVEALEHAPPPAAVAAATPAAPGDAARIQALETRLSALESRPAQQMPDVEGQVSAASAKLNARIAELDASIQKDIAATTARATLANRLRAASLALEAGKPLGDIPDAPPALARFADTAPPTEPALRLSFPRYAEAARMASQPDASETNPVDRAWERIQALVTIRRGDKVIVGSRTATILEAARGKLDAGDLEGAIIGLNNLDDAAKKAVAPWRDDAQALLDARAAMLAMAAKS
jgi:hypothetical protein